MAKTSLIIKQQRLAKKKAYDVRAYHRCKFCGRPRGYIRMFGLCRLCFRQLASFGKLPGIRKASW